MNPWRLLTLRDDFRSVIDGCVAATKRQRFVKLRFSLALHFFPFEHRCTHATQVAANAYMQRRTLSDDEHSEVCLLLRSNKRVQSDKRGSAQ
jgi:hypothetical protein